MIARLEKYFMFDELHTNWRKELLAGLTTFVSMCYVLFVIPSMLAQAGMDKGAVFTATALASALGCIVMGAYARYPAGLAPSLGANAFFVFTVCISMKIPWQTALAGSFVASVIFLLITIFKLREMIINAIPADLKSAISAGIGMFIAFIGLKNGGLIVASKSTAVALGNLTDPATMLTCLGLIVTVILMIKKVPGGIFVGMVITTAVGMATKLIALPTAIMSGAPSMAPTFGEAIKNLHNINTVQMWVVVIIFLLVTFFDTAGTLVALAYQAGFMKDNELPRAGQALMSDSSAMLVGSILGTSPVGTYVESSAGIAVGGRSGMTGVFTGIFFIIGMFFSPLLAVITNSVTAPALIIVGVLMASNMAKVHWDDFEIAVPSFLVIIGMPLTYSIANGMALGMIAYPITMLAAKRGKEVSPIMYVLAVIFICFLWIISREA
ncbi:NCS2 family permease [Enterococcus hirae]|nr:NCS2 family permease [Enterococcaceae bacterium]MCI1918574.1 NCS2 family permease [Enterococcaceae bacterium]MDM8212342.1 NCS2 family permease [Enterococcus hirae]